MSFEHVFNKMDVSADPFAMCELHGKCDLGLGRRTGSTLHYILAGHGEIILYDKPTVEVSPGSLVLIPALQRHTLRSYGQPGAFLPQCQPAELKLAQFITGEETGNSGGLLAICSEINVGLRGIDDLIDLVRQPLVEDIGTDGGAAASLERLLAELSSPALGSRALVRALLLECMIHLLRGRLQSGDSGLGWMTALSDERLWAALQAMLESPGSDHSVESLAGAAGMSRSSFAERFAVVHEGGPMSLLRDLRMKQACILLEQSDLPVKRIADQVGFKSRSAFTRTFEGMTGMSPGAFRTAAQTS